ncbi:MAG: hypothetical protein ABJP87_15395 [Bauldia litoralis]|uniref:hypothetical protein n=1 Tax=Bauldia litoralis TaxID=665467 RepID=UPI0032972CAD
MTDTTTDKGLVEEIGSGWTAYHETTDRMQALCEKHGCPPGSNRFDWLDEQLSRLSRITAPVEGMGLETSAEEWAAWMAMRDLARHPPSALKRAARDLETLTARLRVAEEALEPFAEAAKHLPPGAGDNTTPADLTGFDLRRARAALSQPEAGAEDAHLHTSAAERAELRARYGEHGFCTVAGRIISIGDFIDDLDTLAAAPAPSGMGKAVEDWLPIDDAAKAGQKVGVVIEDIYDPEKHNVTIAYFDDERWWGSGISSHWQPVLYRPISVDGVEAALSALRAEENGDV